MILRLGGMTLSSDSQRERSLDIVAAMGSAELSSLDDLRRTLHPSFECSMGASREPLDGDAYVASIAETRAAFPDLTYEVPAPPIADGHRVATTFRITGTHSGAFRGVPPTGVALDVAGLSMFEVEDDRVRRMWSSLDSLAFATQLGLI